MITPAEIVSRMSDEQKTICQLSYDDAYDMVSHFMGDGVLETVLMWSTLIVIEMLTEDEDNDEQTASSGDQHPEQS